MLVQHHLDRHLLFRWVRVHPPPFSGIPTLQHLEKVETLLATLMTRSVDHRDWEVAPRLVLAVKCGRAMDGVKGLET